MKTLTPSRCVLSLTAAAALLAACGGGSQPPIGAPDVSAVSDRMGKPASYRVVYSFGKPHDGALPRGTLAHVKDTLYGTTEYGGAGTYGTAFSVTTSGKETVLYSFGTNKNDGDGPYAGLSDLNGTLYGTTISGGAYCCGTVFSVTTGGTERVVHSFSNRHEGGSTLTGGLIDINETLYGTTLRGSYTPHHCGCGTVFSLTTDGTLKVLRSFGEGDDGYWLPAGLIDVNGTLYGTTFAGGAYGRGGSSGEQVGGVVFSMTMDGKEKVLHAFGKGSDGLGPDASLIDVNGTLYGTTEDGGAHNHGTVFSITRSGVEKVVYSFGDVPDGAFPQAGLINVNGTLYGTTSGGGAYRYASIPGGTVFSVTTGGKEKVLHSFGNGNDGYIPLGGLLDMNGTLYGTTSGGGKYGGSAGYGTVFALTP
jgi:uncharacterized repeat protein (TIGR03803 family)